MRTKLTSLDYEVTRLKAYEPEVGRLQALLAVREAELLESQQMRTLAETKAAEYEGFASQLEEQARESTNLQTQLSETKTRLVETEIKLAETEVHLAETKTKLNSVETHLLTAVIEKEEAKENQKATAELLEGTESKYRKLKKKYYHYKAKAAQFLKQLSFLPWFRDQSWARGYHWGFESFRTLAKNPSVFQINLSTVPVNFLPIPEQVAHELHDLGAELLPDAPRWAGGSMGYPQDSELPSVTTDDSRTTSDGNAAEDSRAPGS